MAKETFRKPQEKCVIPYGYEICACTVCVCVCVCQNLAHSSESRVTGRIQILDEELDTVGDHTEKDRRWRTKGNDCQPWNVLKILDAIIEL